MKTAIVLATLLPASLLPSTAEEKPTRPNILFCLSDDQSWPHASAYGEPVVATPVFDRIASRGALFTNAYCASPSCTPSRSAILTGQDIWRIGEGGQLFGTLPAKHPTYTDLLKKDGYRVGYSDKGWAPGNITAGGRSTNGAGTQYKTFAEFFEGAAEGQPWCFWFGSRDPHRGYAKGSGIKAGMDPNKVRVPAFLPDTAEVRSDLCDYYLEIQRFDTQIGEMLKLIESAGQIDNTLVIVTSDNGMPFPRAKANLYDSGARMPLAIQWPKQMKGNRKIDDFINLTDLAPTFLEAAGLPVPEVMTGRSLLTIMRAEKSGRVDPERDSVVTGRERHAWCRTGGLGYPGRMIRTQDYLYIRNYEPDRWPAGEVEIVTNEGPYGDIDNSPSKRLMLEQKDTFPKLYALSFGKRPKEELYDCRKDPDQMTNLATDPEYASVLKEMSTTLTARLKASGDPRESTGEAPWDDWKYYGRKNW